QYRVECLSFGALNYHLTGILAWRYLNSEEKRKQITGRLTSLQGPRWKAMLLRPESSESLAVGRY
ncbi:MAG: hypothetical protein HWN66_08460, partial [Candidatus Helarchaeota archaeon]|nr:hypothetical protein [Candidatus Helarchaeota archaeon]